MGAKRDTDFEREEKRERKKPPKKEDFLSFAFFHVSFFFQVLSSVFYRDKV